jgi:ASC-1-like (ASCH) protein
MKKIIKGVQTKYFKAVTEGRKRFEVRLADFKCRPGDTLILQEQKSGSDELTGNKIECEVLYKYNTKELEKFYSKKDIDKHGLVIMAIRRRYRF